MMVWKHWGTWTLVLSQRGMDIPPAAIIFPHGDQLRQVTSWALINFQSWKAVAYRVTNDKFFNLEFGGWVDNRDSSAASWTRKWEDLFRKPEVSPEQFSKREVFEDTNALLSHLKKKKCTNCESGRVWGPRERVPIATLSFFLSKLSAMAKLQNSFICLFLGRFWRVFSLPTSRRKQNDSFKNGSRNELHEHLQLQREPGGGSLQKQGCNPILKIFYEGCCRQKSLKLSHHVKDK